MLTSVVKQILDRDVLCLYGFTKLRTNEFEFPYNAATLIGGKINGIAASIGDVDPISFMSSKDIVARTAFYLKSSDGLSNLVTINRDHSQGRIIVEGDVNVYDISFDNETVPVSLHSFYALYKATKTKVDSYASNLNILTSSVNTKLVEIFTNMGAATISSTTWLNLSYLDQRVDSASNPFFISGTFSSTVTAGEGVYVTTGDVILSAGNLSVTGGDITATNGNIIATAGNIVATAGNITTVDGDFSSSGAGGLLLVNGDISTVHGDVSTGDGMMTAGSTFLYKGMVKTDGQVQTITSSEIGTESARKYLKLSGETTNFFKISSSELPVTGALVIYGIEKSVATPPIKAGTIIYIYVDDVSTDGLQWVELTHYSGTPTNYDPFLSDSNLTLKLGKFYLRVIPVMFDGTYWRVVGSLVQLNPVDTSHN